MGNPSDIFLTQYRDAAGEGSVVELKERMLAEKVPELEQYAHHQKLEHVELKIIEFFFAHLSQKECETLKLCRQLRNKLLHGDFYAARVKLGELGAPPERGGVQRIKLDDREPIESLFSKIGAARSEICKPDCVADTKSTAEGRVFGWLLELGVARDFLQAVEVFKGAGAIIERLMSVADKLERKKRN